MGGKSREKGGNTPADSTWLKNENMKWSVFLEIKHFSEIYKSKKLTEIKTTSALNRDLHPMNILIYNIK